MPTDENVADVVAERLTALLEARLRARDKLKTERSQRFIPLARSLAEDDDGLEVITMLLDDDYQRMLHAPVPQPAEETKSSESPASSSGEKARSKRRRSRRRR